MTGCNCNNNLTPEDNIYVTPNMWNLYNVQKDTSTASATKTIPIFNNSYVGRATRHYAKDRLEYRKCNNYNPATGKQCKTCAADCIKGAPNTDFGVTQKMAYSKGIVNSNKYTLKLVISLILINIIRGY